MLQALVTFVQLMHAQHELGFSEAQVKMVAQSADKYALCSFVLVFSHPPPAPPPLVSFLFTARTAPRASRATRTTTTSSCTCSRRRRPSSRCWATRCTRTRCASSFITGARSSRRYGVRTSNFQRVQLSVRCVEGRWVIVSCASQSAAQAIHRLQHGVLHPSESSRRRSEGITWRASSRQATVGELALLWLGFADALSAFLEPRIADNETVIVRNGCIKLPNGKLIYASDHSYGRPWHSHASVADPDVAASAEVVTYVRVELLFQFRGRSLCLCRFLRPQHDFDNDGSRRDLPDSVWGDFASCLSLPSRNSSWESGDNAPLEPAWDILPVSALLQPVLLLPIPCSGVAAVLADNNARSYWLHAQWAYSILPEVSDDGADDPVLSAIQHQRLLDLSNPAPQAASPPAAAVVVQSSAHDGEHEGGEESDEEIDFLVQRG